MKKPDGKTDGIENRRYGVTWIERVEQMNGRRPKLLSPMRCGVMMMWKMRGELMMNGAWRDIIKKRTKVQIFFIYFIFIVIVTPNKSFFKLSFILRGRCQKIDVREHEER